MVYFFVEKTTIGAVSPPPDLLFKTLLFSSFSLLDCNSSLVKGQNFSALNYDIIYDTVGGQFGTGPNLAPYPIWHQTQFGTGQ